MEELKPCPFCGGKAKFHGQYKYAIYCSNHDCIVAVPAIMYKTKEIARKSWNKRIGE